MEKTRFCYCCRVHHPESQMRLFRTRQGERWRCVASIEAARRSPCERDEFGRQQTQINRDADQRAAAHSREARLREYALT